MKKMFRKALAILLCIVIVFCSAPLAGFVGVELPSFGEIFGIKAEAATSGTCGENLTWSFDESTGTLTISGEGSMTDFESSDYVPWYDYCLLIKKVIISDGVTSIGGYAFIWCENLTSIKIPDGVMSIGEAAFYNCCTLTSITIPDSVTSIGNYVFAFCESLTSIKIPDGVTSIGESAFEECTSLTSITLPDNVTSIGKYAFCGCPFTEIAIPDSVTSIDKIAFYDCTYLTDVYYAGNEEEWNSITIGSDNECLTEAAIHYDYQQLTWIVDNEETVVVVKAGEAITVPNNPVKEGYTFAGWVPEVPEVMPDYDLVFTATWIGKKTCTISFVYDVEAPEGADELYKDIPVLIGDFYILPSISPLEGIEFDYWYSSNGVKYPANYEYKVTDDETFIAKWICSKYNLIFDEDGGSEVEDKVLVADEIITLPETVREDYILIGWTDEGGNIYSPNDSFVMPAEDTVLTAVWQKYAMEGDGTAENPYQITDKYELDAVRNNLNAHYVLMNDIKFSEADFAEGGEFYNDGKGFEPIGSYSARFAGVFDGNGFSIIDIRIENVSQASVFGYISTEGIVRNLGIENGTFNAKASATTYGNGTETLAPSAYAAAIAYINSGLIEECYSKSSIKAVANANAGTQMHACQSTAYAAGIAVVNNGTVRNCYNNSSVDSTATAYVWYTVSAVADTYACGIAATSNGTNSVIENCYSTTEGTTYAVTGRLDYSLEYPEGVKEPIVGKNSGTFKNCYYLNSISDVSYGDALSDEQMKAKESFIGFDFNEIWFITSNGDYPYPQLRANPYTELVPSTSVSFESESIELEIGETVTPEVTVEPSDTTDNVTFTSSDESIVIVSESGEIIAVGVGTATITATTTSGITATCEITVAQISYQLIWNVDGETTVVSVKAGDAIVVPADPVKEGYTFAGWTPAVPDVMPENDVEFTAVWEEVIPENSCGDGVYWIFDEATGTLTISGTGAMDNWSSNTLVPWYSVANSIKSVIIENGVISIGNYAFYFCTKLASITIPNSVISIGIYSFYYCENLANVTIPDSVTSIGGNAFEYSGITSIIIPDGVTNISKNAFCGCLKLKTITVNSDNPEYSSDKYGVLFNKDKTSLIQYPIGNTRTQYSIPSTVKIVENSAFSQCTNLTSVTIPDGITTICDYAFDGCESITGITIPKSVTSIGAHVFISCTNLKTITVDSANTAYSSDNYGVLYNKDKTVLIQYPIGNTRISCILPDGVTTICDYAFFSCENLRTIKFGNGLKNIGEYAFFYCVGITNITLPDSVVTIKDYAFRHCNKLTDVYYAGSEEEWNAITTELTNNSLLGANIHFAKYKTCWNIDGKTTVVSVKAGDKIIPPADPIKEGYTFAGWTPEVPEVMPENDVEFTAVWKKNCTVKFSFTNGEPDDTILLPCEVSIAEGDVLVLPSYPEHSNYLFDGWYDENGIRYPEGFEYYVKKDTTLYCNWIVLNSTVSFYGYEALAESPYMSADPSVVLGSANYHFGETIAFPAESSFPANAQIDGEYYTFVGWSKTVGGTVLTDAELYTQTMPAEDTAYYAVYERVKVMLIPNDDAEYWVANDKTCTTVIDRDGGKVDDYNEDDSAWYVFGLKDKITVNSTIDNSHLSTYIDVSGDGYYEVVDFKVKDGVVGTGAVINVYDNITDELVESFSIIIYGDVNGDGAITNIDHAIVLAEAEGTINKSDESSDDYDPCFVKAADMNGNGIIDYFDAAVFKNYVIAYLDIDQTTGKWFDYDEYSLFFYTDETLKVSHDVKFYSGDETIVLPEVPTKDGYNFVGWFDYETNEPLALKMPEKTVFAYAVWEESLEHTVTYYVDGEVYETYSALFGEEVTIPADPVKEGYTFAGWTPEVPDVMPESDVEFTATWTANKYKVKWNIDGMTMSQSIAYGTEIPVPDDPEKDGFEFAGWNPEIPATMPAEDITITAMWNAKGYIITWVVDGVETQTSVPYGETITVPENPTKEGHTFVEWVPEIPETMPANDLTFTANFNVNSYYVTWIVDGAATVSNVQYGQPIVPPENPVKDGFKFMGWTPAIPASMPSYDMAFVAVWVTDYTIDFSFDSVDIENGGTTQLEVIVSPEPTETPEIAWSSSDESVATVDENGLVTAISCGSAVITAELDEKTAFVTVNVAHSYTSETTEATCTQNGFTTYTCSVCGDVYTDNVTEAKGHEYTETVVASSCTGTGYTKYECSVCGDTYTDNETPAAGHSYDAIPIKPTCTSGGYTINMCSVCGQAYKSDAVDALGHNYNEKVVEATCVTGGYTEHTCLNCGDSYQDNIVESGEHNYVVTNVVVATCTDDGYTEFTCSYCDDSYQGNKIDATGHTITSVTNAATCTNGGYTLNVCNVCNNYTSITNQTEALGHEYITEVVTATCESGGYSRHTCTRGDHVYTSDETPALGHNYEATEIKATCIQNGCILNICLNCGRVNKSGATSAYGHSFSDWITVTEAGDNIEGLQTRTCKNCGYTEEKILPMLQRTTYTATFVADGNVVSYVEFLEGATSLVEPEVPQKHRYSGEWEEYTLTDSDITVNAEYTLIDLDDLSGIDFDKNASYNSATGEATISLYAASEAKTMISQTSKKVPLDIVLVVDQSGSMAEKLGGRVSKQDALIESANDFVNSVYADASANGVDHRIAVVGFGMGNKANGYEYPAYLNTEILTTGGNPVNMKDAKSSDYALALMSVNANGAMNANIVNAINSIDAKGATAADYGLSMACNVFANNADADGRQRIVVFMTDGEPTFSSEFSNSVATAAIQQAYQLKNTYDASVYSVGIFNSANGQLTKFMNYVSSNCDDAKSVSGNFDIDTDKFFVTVDNTDALSAVFTEIVVENITRTTDFDNITLIDTVSKYFTLTSQQEKALRISAIEKFGIKNSDIMVTRNADGTTTIEIKSIHPEEIGDKFVVSLDFAVSANENASVAGNYATNTEDAGIIVGDAENYECIFTAPTVNIPTDRNTVVFNVNGEIYAIKSVVSNGAITAPETDFIGDYKFTGWNIPAGTVANQPVAEFDATLVNQECVVIWNTDAGTETIIYAPGDVIDVPDVAPNSNGDSFRRWNGEVPVTMPAESIEFTAVYGDHEHKYIAEIIKAVTCLEDGETKYTCSVCDSSYTETVRCAGEHTWKAITSPADKNGHTPERFKCEVCGVSDNKTLEYMLLENEEGNIQQEFNYVDENGNKCQPDGDLTITVPLDEYVDADRVNVYRVNDDGTRTQCDSRFEDGVVEFDTNHFSTYIFEPIYQCMIEGNHPDCNSDSSCDVCRKWLGITVTWVVDGKETESRALTGTELVQPETPVKEGYTFIGWTPAVPETSPEYDVTYTAVFEVNSYTVKWIVDGVETVETYEFDSSITVPVIPAMDGYFFAGWTPAVPEKMPAKDMTFTAKFADYDVSKIKVTIATPQTRTVQYRESIILYANATNLPEGAKIKWSADNNCVTIKSSNDGKTCTVTSKSNGNVVITAYIVDANGDVITNEKCVRISDSEGITSEVTFWSMIIYAFRQMFSGNPFLSFIFKDLFN